MIRIQALKEPKKTSGKKLDPKTTILFKGVEITNKSKKPVYVDWYERKPSKKAEETTEL